MPYVYTVTCDTRNHVCTYIHMNVFMYVRVHVSLYAFLCQVTCEVTDTECEVCMCVI